MRSSGTGRGKKASGSDNADGPVTGGGESVLYGTYGMAGVSGMVFVSGGLSRQSLQRRAWGGSWDALMIVTYESTFLLLASF